MLTMDELDDQYLAAIEANSLPTRHLEGQKIAIYVIFATRNHRYTTTIKGTHFSPEEKGQIDINVQKIFFLGGKLQQLILHNKKWTARVFYDKKKEYQSCGVAVRFLNAKRENE